MNKMGRGGEGKGKMERNEECRITHNGVVSESVWREKQIGR